MTDIKDRFPDEKVEYAMQLIALDVIVDISDQFDIDRNVVMDVFMHSQTAQMLFDRETELWSGGPAYVTNEFMREIFGAQINELYKERNNEDVHA